MPLRSGLCSACLRILSALSAFASFMHGGGSG